MLPTSVVILYTQFSVFKIRQHVEWWAVYLVAHSGFRLKQNLKLCAWNTGLSLSVAKNLYSMEKKRFSNLSNFLLELDISNCDLPVGKLKSEISQLIKPSKIYMKAIKHSLEKFRKLFDFVIHKYVVVSCHDLALKRVVFQPVRLVKILLSFSNYWGIFCARIKMGGNVKIPLHVAEIFITHPNFHYEYLINYNSNFEIFYPSHKMSSTALSLLQGRFHGAHSRIQTPSESSKFLQPPVGANICK